MKWFNHLTISAKLALAFLLIAVLTSVLGIFSLLELAKVNQSGVTTNTYLVPAMRDAAELQSGILRIRMAHIGVAKEVEDDGMGDPKKYLDNQIRLARQLIDGLVARLVTEDSQEKIASIQARFTTLVSLNNEAFQLIDEGQTREGIAILDRKIPMPSTVLLGQVQSLNVYLTEQAAMLQEASSTTYEAARLWVMALLLVVFSCCILLGVFISRAVSGPLRRAVAIAQHVAQGNLTDDIVIHSKDETGQLLQALKVMNGNLQQIVLQIRQGTEMMNTASTEISAGNLDLSNRTEYQASSLEKTASAMEELTATVKQNADNARQANQLAVSASDVAVQGGNVVAQVVSTMASINDSSKKIVDIISVIDGIAFQTNILALNAAVEAARAGEQGRGFAVVASEVRSLAQRSASAAKEIKVLIDDSVGKVSTGSVLVGQAGSTMTEVVASIQRVSDIVAEITAASQEQSAGIGQVNDAIVQMDEVTQQNAALVEQGAAATQSLQQQARELLAAVSVFKIDGNPQSLSLDEFHASPAPKDITPQPASLGAPVPAGV